MIVSMSLMLRRFFTSGFSVASLPNRSSATMITTPTGHVGCPVACPAGASEHLYGPTPLALTGRSRDQVVAGPSRGDRATRPHRDHTTDQAAWFLLVCHLF